jgi:mannose-1-phosphate guanylyltransferase
MRRDRDFEHAYAVIMAGGSGTRFWPLSRLRRPKQLLNLLGERTLLAETVARVLPVIPAERIYVFTNDLLRAQVVRCLPQLPKNQIVAEPAARNTAPTIGLAAHEILRRDPEGLMVVLPSDHVIRKPGAFRRMLRAACRWAVVDGRSVILGLEPTRPDTGYGYVRKGLRVARVVGQPIYQVENFTEKPPLATARRYLASRRYLWNGGMFIWQASTLLRNLARTKREMARGLERIAQAGGVRATRTLRRIFPRLEKISIDYAVMEKAPDVFVVAADIGWSDVGSWAVVYDLQAKDSEGNVRPRASLCLNARGNIIVSPRKFVVAVDVRDLVIVETADALLVAARERSQDVGKAVQELERRGLVELL